MRRLQEKCRQITKSAAPVENLRRMDDAAFDQSSLTDRAVVESSRSCAVNLSLRSSHPVW